LTAIDAARSPHEMLASPMLDGTEFLSDYSILKFKTTRNAGLSKAQALLNFPE